MNPSTPDRHDIESLVRDYLQGEEGKVDAGRILAGVRARERAGRVIRARPSRVARSAARWALGVAAVCLILGFARTARQAHAKADAVKLVRQAREAFATNSNDRSYRILIDLEPGMGERSPFLAALATQEFRLWTRPDRYWIESNRTTRPWSCGRDSGHHAWVASSARVGLDFDPQDVPEPLDEALDLFSLDLETVLHLLATEFDVTPPVGDDEATPGRKRIRGIPRGDRPRPGLRSVDVIIDEDTKIVREVVLWRVRLGRPIARVTFSFVEAASQPDHAYELPAHLAPGSSIFGREQPLKRHRELVRFFGGLLLKGE